MNGKMVLIAGVVCSLISTRIALGYSDGIGTSDFPYQISSPADLISLGQTPDDYDKHFILMADLDLAGYTFDQAVIAPDTNAEGGFQGAIFGGVFDGNGHVISRLAIHAPEKSFIGLFGFSSGQIKNLGIQDTLVQGGGYVGGLAGVQRSGAITSCSVSGSVSGTGNYIGGVVGYFEWSGTISDSVSTCTVTGGNSVGGLVGFDGGWWKEVIITRCYATGEVSGTGGAVGGLVGEDAGTITSCYATGKVIGVSGIGGLCGSHSGTISQSSASGAVTGSGDSVGGLIGGNDGPIISCSATGTVHGASSVGGLAGENRGTISTSFANGSIRGDFSVGGLVGFNYYGKIDSSNATGFINGNSSVGGLVGRNIWSTITGCYATGTVSGTEGGSMVGGLVGYHHSRTITSSFATGGVSGGDDVGGLVGHCDGYSEGSGSIASCYAKGAVNGSHHVGGLIGVNGGTIRYCYSVGTVSGNTDVGGLVGINQNQGTITSCFWDTQRSGIASSSGGTGKGTDEMQSLSTFTSAGWDFIDEIANGTEDLWTICEGTNYPWLTWQSSLTDWVCPDGVGLEDLLYLSERWMAATPETIGAADANGDGKVDMLDLAILASTWMRE
jgi:hypothetical protein